MINTRFDFNVKPLEYVSKPMRGFIVKPRDANGNTWGQPFEDAEGNPIVPGTLNGPNDNAFLSANGTWGISRSLEKQNVGNIDWKGPWTNNDKNRRRVVSFHGPQQRYWNNGSFSYGTDPTHRHVYSNGKVIAIAPNAVLGAAITTAYEIIGFGVIPQYRDWVIVICPGVDSDIVYGRPNLLNLLESEITEEHTFEYSRMRSEDNPNGWRYFGETLGYADALAPVIPEAPWFFSTNGLQARTMRRHTITQTNNGGDPFEDEVYREIRCVINMSNYSAVFTLPDSTGFIDAGNGGQRWTVTTESKRDNYEYVQPSEESADGYSHTFEEDIITARKTLSGKSKIAVDFNPDDERWVYAWLDADGIFGFIQAFTIGVDAPEHPSPNTGNTNGPQPVPSPYVPSIGDHYNVFALGFNHTIDLKIGIDALMPEDTYGSLNIQDTRSGSSSVLAGQPPNPDNPFLAFVQRVHTYFQYLDIRYGVFCAYTYAAEARTLEVANSWVTTKYKSNWAALLDERDYFFEPDEDHHVFMLTAPEQATYPQDSMWNRATHLDVWPLIVDEEHEHYSYSGVYSPFNEDGSEYDGPYYQQLVPEWRKIDTFPYWFPHSVTDMLRGNETQITGVFGSTEKKEVLVAIEYIDENVQSLVSSAKGWGVEGDPLSALDAGDRIHPGGVI